MDQSHQLLFELLLGPRSKSDWLEWETLDPPVHLDTYFSLLLLVGFITWS